MVYVFSTGIPEIVKGQQRGFLISLISALALIIVACLFRFYQPIRKYANLLTLIIILAFNFSRFFFATNVFDKLPGGLLYFRGYGFASLEIVLITRFFEFKHKAIAMVIAFALKLGIIGWLESVIFNPDGLIRHICIDAFIIYTFYSFGKKERQVFKAFYEYRESLTKFKQLLSEYLPQSIIIFNSTISEAVFSNETFNLNFHSPSDVILFSEPTVGGVNSELFTSEHSSFQKISLSSLQIDQNTIREVGSKQNLAKLSSLDLQNTIRKLMRENLLVEKAWIFSASYTKKETRRLFEIITKKIKWDGQDSVAVIFNDTTYQESLVALKLADANKDKILGTVSHELRTPLNAIIGILQICEDKVEDRPDVMEYLALCRDSANLLLSLVNSLLDLQQLGQGKLKINSSTVHLRKVLKNILRLFHFQGKSSGISLNLKVDDDVVDEVKTDESRLKQIIINLLANAVKFTFKGSITLHVSQDLTDSEKLQFSVIDTGIGIQEKDQEKLFKMYGKLEDKEGVNKNGVGLGLTIANALSAALAGRTDSNGIELQSQYGSGSSFSFKILKNLLPPPLEPSLKTLGGEGVETKLETESKVVVFENNSVAEFEELIPFHNRSRLPSYLLKKKIPTNVYDQKDFSTISQTNEIFNSRLESQKKSSLPGPGPVTIDNCSVSARGSLSLGVFPTQITSCPNGKLILVVDDNSFNLFIAENLLKDLGYHVKTARNGKEAIEIVESAAKESLFFSVIFMDCQMPIMDGYEATKILTKMIEKNEIKQVPIIALTANTRERDIQRCYDSGMTDFLSKPFVKFKLLDILSKLDP